MRTVYRAFFAESGCSLITLVGNRVEKYSLEPTENGELRPCKLWTTKLKHCSNGFDKLSWLASLSDLFSIIGDEFLNAACRSRMPLR